MHEAAQDLSDDTWQRSSWLEGWQESVDYGDAFWTADATEIIDWPPQTEDAQQDNQDWQDQFADASSEQAWQRVSYQLPLAVVMSIPPPCRGLAQSTHRT